MKKYISLILSFALLACCIGCSQKIEFSDKHTDTEMYFTIKDIVYNDDYKCHIILVDWHNISNEVKSANYEGYDIEYLNGDTWESVFKLDENVEWTQEWLSIQPSETVEKSYALNKKLFNLARKGTYRLKVSYYVDRVTMAPGGDFGPMIREYTDVYAEFKVS